MNSSINTQSLGGRTADAPSLREQIGAVTAQIVKLSRELQALMKSPMDPRELRSKSDALQAQIQALQAQLAALLRQQAERAAAGRGDSAGDSRAKAAAPAGRHSTAAAEPLPPGVLAVA